MKAKNEEVKMGDTIMWPLKVVGMYVDEFDEMQYIVRPKDMSETCMHMETEDKKYTEYTVADSDLEGENEMLKNEILKLKDLNNTFLNRAVESREKLDTVQQKYNLLRNQIEELLEEHGLDYDYRRNQND